MKQSGEDYLESILRISRQYGSVRSIDVARDLEVSKPSVSVAIHNLEEQGYLIIRGHELILTEQGLAIAEKVLERHELFYRFFVDMGVAERVAQEDACRMEHALSGESFAAIKRYLEKYPVK